MENRWIRNNFGCEIQDESVGKMVLISYYTRIKLEALSGQINYFSMQQVSLPVH